MDPAEAPLPDDLAALERRLAARAFPEPPAGFRQRVLAAASQELKRGCGGPLDWRWLLAGAAAVLVWINFTTSIINNMDWHLTSEISRSEIEMTAKQFQELMPELPPSEAFRQALLLRARAYAVPVADCQSSLGQVIEKRRHESWDMR